MYKNQLQELAQRSCFNLPSYTCIREGPDHAPRFKAVVNFNGETFDSPHFYSNLRLAEHAAAEAALASLSSRTPSHSRFLDETGVYKNLLQEIAQRVGSPLPRYATYRSGVGHFPVFTGTVQLAGITFRGETAKNKKQAEKNAALAAWLSLKQLAQEDAGSSSEHENNEEQEQIRIARALQKYCMRHRIDATKRFSVVSTPFPPRPSSPQMSTSRILPLFAASGSRPSSITTEMTSQPLPDNGPTSHTQRYPAPFVQCRSPYHGIAPPVTMRSSVPVFSAAPPPPAAQLRPSGVAPQVRMRQAIPVFSAAPPPPAAQLRPSGVAPQVRMRQAIPVFSAPSTPETPLQCDITCDEDVDESTAIKCLEQLEI